MPNTSSSFSTKAHKIVVFGASGHTGRFVVAELARRGMTLFLPVEIRRNSSRSGSLIRHLKSVLAPSMILLHSTKPC